MVQREDFEQRLKELDWTLYRLAKEFAEYRAEGGDVSPASRYHSSIGRAIENPATSRLETIKDIVQVLNGELTIIWDADKVVTIRLEDKTIEALKQRAENEGKTINKVAKQLLLQALSGLPAQKPKKLSELVIDQEPKIYRSFHPAIASAYSAVHQWLANIPDAKGYKDLDFSKDITRSLDKTDLKSTAFQFYTLFPHHYFEVSHILDNVIHSTRLLNRIKYNPRICLVDVGCAMGAATAALIEKVITLSKADIPSKTIEIVCVGIDANLYGYAIYKKLMEEIQRNIAPFNISLEFKAINEPLPQATLRTISYFQNKLEQWDSSVKVLSNLFLMQLDVAASLSQDELLKKQRNKKLQALGLEPEPELETDKEFWQDESLSFKRLLEEIPVENLHLMTIGTKNLEKYLQETIQINEISEGINAINEALNKFIGKDHRISVLLEGKQEVYFETPVDSYWQEQQQSINSFDFEANLTIIRSNKVEEDNQWNKLISVENIELAWVKARSNVFSESFYDEIEIRLFDQNLDKNLQRLVDDLVDKLYSDNLLPTNQDISYQFVKSRGQGRPKQLTRLEEEILAVAILQTIGQEKKEDWGFYSYKINSALTEELYEHYWQGYKKFLVDAEKSAQRHPGGGVLRTDVKSYYTKVIQKQLRDITEKELQVDSTRIQWLLGEILEKKLDGHEDGKGLKQGTITSGFYANLYLKQIDDYFQTNEKWKDIIEYHRYVDDIIIVVRHSMYLEDIEAELENKLSEVELELNKHKTEHYKNTAEFLPTTEDDNYLDKLNEEFNYSLYPIWIMNHLYRTQFEFAHRNNNEELWWRMIKVYKQCLYSLGFSITEDWLSRKIYQKLVDPNLKSNKENILPPFPEAESFISILNWANAFRAFNQSWLTNNERIKKKIVNLFLESLQELRETLRKQSEINPSQSEIEKRPLNLKQRRLERRIRWSINKLIILGFDQVWEEVVELICDTDSFIIRNLLDVIVSLASQGHENAIKKLWKYYQNHHEVTSGYVRAVILESIRFLPIIDFDKWQLIFQLATEGKSDIEKLKATETWLYLGERAKPFVQPQYLQNIVSALKSDPPPFLRLKKNYLLILGMYQPNLLDDVAISGEEKQDYLIKDALKLAAEGKVSDIFQEVEPARVRKYYNTQKVSTSKDKSGYLSLH